MRTFAKYSVHLFEWHSHCFGIHCWCVSIYQKITLNRTYGSTLQSKPSINTISTKNNAPLTQNETAGAEKSVHRVEPPLDDLLQVRRRLSHQKIERPICGGRNADPLCAHSEGKNLERRAQYELTRIIAERRTSGGYNQGRGPQLPRKVSLIRGSEVRIHTCIRRTRCR